MNPNSDPLLLKGMEERPDYEWNKEFIKLINQEVCPYCENPLIVKGISKQCKCSFYLLGAPETLAFTEKISEKAPTIYYGNPPATEICPECGRIDFIEDHGRAEKICHCGLVIEGPPSYSGYRKISYDTF